MSVRDDVLEILDDSRGSFVSGTELAARLNVSRTAVWKAVCALKSDGYNIEVSRHGGYMLAPDSDILSDIIIKKYLGDASSFYTLDVRDTVGSTNAEAKRLASDGAAEGYTVIAGRQTGGHGRFSRQFHSPDGGVYISVILRPSLSPADSVLMTAAAAVAVAEAVEAVSGRSASIKWVNDIVVDGLKVCGILTEAALSVETGMLDYAVLGIGVNVTEPSDGFPDNLRGIAGSLFSRTDASADARSRVTAEVLSRFRGYYAHLGERTFLDEYRRRSYLIGECVTVHSGSSSTPARVLGIDDSCRLIVEYDDRTTATLGSGEVSVRKTAKL